ncbi:MULTISPECIES: hypothetical protein [Clostridium]|uniref:hypothetical protein n=1 Tax=Clostridium TaxID=1485 RepID=UPI0015D4F57A|nr:MULTISPECIES: hypothetical protein [Clostridium]MDU2155379.1 hypothetical protein [Clostridium sp.]
MSVLEVLINSINAQIEELNKSNFKIYDSENKDYFIDTVSYCSEKDKLIVNFKEDK